MDLHTILSQHCTDPKLHDEIISVIKSHSNEQHLSFSSNDLKSRSSQLKDLEKNMDTAKLKPKDVVVDLTLSRQATVSIFDSETMMMSLLTDPTLMQPKNLAHGYDIFTGKSGGCQEDSHGKIHTGDAWELARRRFCSDEDSMNMPIALVILGD
jgi:hypothetical protein